MRNLRTLTVATLVTALLVAVYSCASPGSSEAAQREMGLLKQDLVAFAELARELEEPKAAEVAGILALHVGLAEEALAAYTAGTGTTESIWAHLEGAQSILQAYAEQEDDDGLLLAAFAVNAALRRVQAWFPPDPPE